MQSSTHIRQNNVAFVLLIWVLLLLASCDASNQSSAKQVGSTAPNNQNQVNSAITQLLLESAREVYRRSKGDVGSEDISFQTPTAELENPSHAWLRNDAPVESWQYFAMLQNDDNQWIAWQQRFDRARVRPGYRQKSQALLTNKSTSDWEFSDVMLASTSVWNDTGAEAVLFEQDAQRVALGLAGARADAREGSGETDTARIWVDQIQALVQAPSYASNTTSNCGISHELTAPGVLLSLAASQCPQIEGANELTATVFVHQAKGQLDLDGNPQGVVGTAWSRHLFGPPPGKAAAAVVLDRVWLALDNGWQLELDRTRRASGNGPSTVLAKWQIPINSTTNSRPVENDQRYTLKISDTVLFEDRQSKTEGVKVDTWILRDPDTGLDLTLTPLNLNNIILAPDSPVWFGAVTVSGGQTGVGFIEYQLL